MAIGPRYLIRLDDACPTIHWERWERVAALLDDYDVRPIVGVIPDNQDEFLHINPPRANFWEVVSKWQRKGWTIGLHGYQHRYVTQDGGLVPISNKSEFAGLALQIQEEKIRKGWQIFQSHRLKPSVWIAPAHSFDKNTLIALKRETDIELISDGIALNCFTCDGFHWIPQQLWRFRRMPFGTFTICLHPNKMSEGALQQLERDLSKHRRMFIGLSEVQFFTRAKNSFEKLVTRAFMLRANMIRE
jgi:predicted deacetylase